MRGKAPPWRLLSPAAHPEPARPFVLPAGFTPGSAVLFAEQKAQHIPALPNQRTQQIILFFFKDYISILKAPLSTSRKDPAGSGRSGFFPRRGTLTFQAEHPAAVPGSGQAGRGGACGRGSPAGPGPAAPRPGPARGAGPGAALTAPGPPNPLGSGAQRRHLPIAHLPSRPKTQGGEMKCHLQRGLPVTLWVSQLSPARRRLF